MNAADRFIAVTCDGITQVHANGSCLGSDYATFCGLDGNDEAIGMVPAPLQKNPKIDCDACKAMILGARQWTKKDFAR